ncbi:hypothetical protein CR513_16104, partial [Mucuna pruriens]
MCPTLQEIEPDSVESVGAIVSIESESREIYSLEIWICPKHVSSEVEQLSIASRIASQHYKSDVVNWFRNIRFQTILNAKGGVSALGPVNAESEPEADSQVQQQARIVPLAFPARTILARRFETNGDFLKMFRSVEINILLLNAIKQIPKYVKFLKELCMHKRKKLKGGVETGGVVLVLIKHEDDIIGYPVFSLFRAPLATIPLPMPC